MKIYTRVVMTWDGEVLEEESYEYEGPLAQCGGGGGGDTTTVQQADPWEGQMPYLERMFQEAERLYNEKTPQLYPAATLAPINSDQIAARQMVRDAATGSMTSLGNKAASANQFLLGDVLKASSNPYLADYAEGAVRPIYNNLTRNVLPSINAGAIAAGQGGGSSRRGIAEGIAMSDANQQALDVTSKIYSDAYGQGLDAMAKGIAFAPQTGQNLLAPGSAVGAVGDSMQSANQAQIDAAIREWEARQRLPWDTLGAYQSLIQGSYGGTGSSTMTSQQPGLAQSLVGAAATGLGAYAGLSAIGGVAATAAPWAAGIIALASLL